MGKRVRKLEIRFGEVFIFFSLVFRRQLVIFLDVVLELV